MTYKPPLTADKQVEKLATYKRVVYKKISKQKAQDYLIKYNYTDLITPFKYNFCKWKNEKEVDKDSNGNHIYERNVDFKEYLDCYKKERKIYPLIYKNLSEFENIFKSVLAYRVLTFYNITDDIAFDNFINDLLSNMGTTPKKISKFDKFYGTHYREVCSSYFNGYKHTLEHKYNDNIYVFFENLSLGNSSAIYNCCNTSVQKQIFADLIKYNVSFGFNDYKIFGQKLLIIVKIRNKVYHCSSLQIAIKFHDIKTKEIRYEKGPFSQEAYRNVIKAILKPRKKQLSLHFLPFKGDPYETIISYFKGNR